jgi:radical SAM superfamily enzyme YgiQ (UPF0313 family)
MTLLNQNRKHIVLINPPNKKIVLRDLYSSTISKGKYNWPNADLLSLSAILSKSFDVTLLDANTLRFSIKKTIEMTLKNKNLIGVVVAIGKSVIDQDYEFVRQLKIESKNKNINLKLAVVGGIIFYNSENELKKNNFIDACILNYTTEDSLNYFSNDLSSIYNMTYRKNGKIIKCKEKLPEWGFKLPIPEHHQLPLKKYRLSHGRNVPLTSVLTSYGCPHKCSFCVSGRIKYRYRDPVNILDELKYLKSIGIREINFRDNIFGFHKKTTTQLLEGMISNNLNFSWVSDSRLDILDEPMIKLMAKAGCHALHFGIESYREKTLIDYDKNIKDIDCIEKTIQLCKKYKILSVGYFILGLPGESMDDVNKTIDYSISLNCDYASFNLPMPIVGTELRDNSIKEGLISKIEEKYDGSFEPILTSRLIKKSEMLKLQRKAYRKFYFRFIFIYEKMINIKSLFQVKMLFTEGFNLILSKK